MTTRNSTLVGVFDSRAQAEAVIEQLHNAGIPDEQIRYSGSGSSAGGFLAGIKSLFTGEDTTTNLVNDLTGMGLSQDEASFYDNEYRAGRFIVAVNPGERWQAAQVILTTGGAYNYASRSGSHVGTYAQQPDTSAPTTNTGYNSQTTAPDYTTNQTANAGYNTQSPDYPTQTADTNYAQTTSPDYVQPGTTDTTWPGHETTRSADYADADEAQRARLREERLNMGKQPVLDQQIISDTARREKARQERDGDTTVPDADTEQGTTYNNPDQNKY